MKDLSDCETRDIAATSTVTADWLMEHVGWFDHPEKDRNEPAYERVEAEWVAAPSSRNTGGRDQILKRFATVVDHHLGIGSLTGKGWNGYYADIGLLFTNSGDSYMPELMYAPETDQFVIATYADILHSEQDRAREGKETLIFDQREIMPDHHEPA